MKSQMQNDGTIRFGIGLLFVPLFLPVMTAPSLHVYVNEVDTYCPAPPPFRNGGSGWSGGRWGCIRFLNALYASSRGLQAYPNPQNRSPTEPAAPKPTKGRRDRRCTPNPVPTARPTTVKTYCERRQVLSSLPSRSSSAAAASSAPLLLLLEGDAAGGGAMALATPVCVSVGVGVGVWVSLLSLEGDAAGGAMALATPVCLCGCGWFGVDAESNRSNGPARRLRTVVLLSSRAAALLRAAFSSYY